MSHIIDVFSGLSDEDGPKATKAQPQNHDNKEKTMANFLEPSCSASPSQTFHRDDELESKQLARHEKDVEASTNADSDTLVKKGKNYANKRRSKKDKRRERKGISNFSEEEKYYENNGSQRVCHVDNYEYGKPEKPILIKTLTLDKDEYEIALETFLNDEFEGYKLKPEDQIQTLAKEDDYGNTEYKLKLVNPTSDRIQHLTTQMKFRLQEGHGEAKYEIGIADDGTPVGLNKEEMLNSLKTLCTMASILKADVIILRMRDGYQGKTAEVLVRLNQKDGIKLDIKIMLLGDKQSGKSTLIGVLTSGYLDNGSGSARKYVHVHKHEVLSGETSSLSHHILGFDSQGNVTNHTEYGHPSWEQIVDTSTKILTFLDTGGHEKYTTKIVSGLCSFYPDYTLIVISAAEGVTSIAEKHLKLACFFGVPFIIAVTHIDLVNSSDLFDLRSNIERTLRKYCEDKFLVVANNEEDNVILSRTLKERVGIPVFMLSNVKGTNMDLFKSFLNLLPVNNPLSTNINLHSEFYIHTIFNKNNKIILGGTVIKGCIKKHQILFLGPDEKGKFRHIEAASIECKKVPVKGAYCGQSCTIEIKLGRFTQQWIDSSKDAIRRGMVLVDTKSNPKATIEFTAEISLFEEKSTKAILWEGYEPVIISQTCHQVCTMDFDQIIPEEIKEEDLLKLKEFTDSLSAHRTAKKNQNHLPKDEYGLPILKLGKQKSKSQDFKSEQVLQRHENERFVEKSPERKLSSFSRRKLANVFLSTNNIAMKTSSIKSDGGHHVENIKKKAAKQSFDSYFSPLDEILGKSDHTGKMSFQEKIKNIKKNIYMYAEDFAPKKKKKIKFITIEPGQTKVLKFRFKYHSEYMTKGQKIIINDSCMKAVGTIRDIFYVKTLT